MAIRMIQSAVAKLSFQAKDTADSASARTATIAVLPDGRHRSRDDGSDGVGGAERHLGQDDVDHHDRADDAPARARVRAS